MLANCENCEKYALTSDDIFLRKKEPGKTLVVGGSYTALECAGFLSCFGYKVTLMTRNEYLRGFDKEMVEMIKDSL